MLDMFAVSLIGLKCLLSDYIVVAVESCTHAAMAVIRSCVDTVPDSNDKQSAQKITPAS